MGDQKKIIFKVSPFLIILQIIKYWERIWIFRFLIVFESTLKGITDLLNTHLDPSELIHNNLSFYAIVLRKLI